MIAIFMTVVMATSILGACEGGGSTRVSYSLGMGYGGYYGRAPYGYYRPPVIIGGPGPDIDQPVAVPLPEPDMDFGMPEAGFDDFGDFDF
jgi:hypothetical protein